MKTGHLYFLLFCSYGALSAQKIPLKELYRYGDIFNIEGGRVGQQLGSHQRWLNLVVVLDRPLLDGKTYEELVSTSTYPLKEAGILEYNEAHVYLAFVLITLHYAQHGHRIVNKSPHDQLIMTIHLHRGSSGIIQTKILQELLCSALSMLDLRYEKTQPKNYAGFLDAWHIPACKIIIEFRHGYEEKYMGNYAHSDIVFSFSLAGGFSPHYPSGSLLLSNRFVPFDVDTYTVHQEKSYETKNHLCTEIRNILKNPLHSQLVALINADARFLSPNDAKRDLRAQQLSVDDFHEATVFQITKLFSPHDAHQLVTITS